MKKYKVGDYVYYTRKSPDGHFDTIPCEVVKVNPKTVDLTDGEDVYRRIRITNIRPQENTN